LIDVADAKEVVAAVNVLDTFGGTKFLILPNSAAGGVVARNTDELGDHRTFFSSWSGHIVTVGFNRNKRYKNCGKLGAAEREICEETVKGIYDDADIVLLRDTPTEAIRVFAYDDAGTARQVADSLTSALTAIRIDLATFPVNRVGARAVPVTVGGDTFEVTAKYFDLTGGTPDYTALSPLTPVVEVLQRVSFRLEDELVRLASAAVPDARSVKAESKDELENAPAYGLSGFSVLEAGVWTMLCDAVPVAMAKLDLGDPESPGATQLLVREYGKTFTATQIDRVAAIFCAMPANAFDVAAIVDGADTYDGAELILAVADSVSALKKELQDLRQLSTKQVSLTVQMATFAGSTYYEPRLQALKEAVAAAEKATNIDLVKTVGGGFDIAVATYGAMNGFGGALSKAWGVVQKEPQGASLGNIIKYYKGSKEMKDVGPTASAAKAALDKLTAFIDSVDPQTFRDARAELQNVRQKLAALQKEYDDFLERMRLDAEFAQDEFRKLFLDVLATSDLIAGNLTASRIVMNGMVVDQLVGVGLKGDAASFRACQASRDVFLRTPSSDARALVVRDCASLNHVSTAFGNCMRDQQKGEGGTVLELGDFRLLISKRGPPGACAT